MPKALLVANPFATRVSADRLARVRKELRDAGELEVVLTEHPGHATELVTAACRDGVDAVVVFSGDGGFNEALNGLERDVPVGFLPGGGTSVLARALGVPRDPVAAAQQIAEAFRSGRTRRISVGRVNGRRFGFGAGIGLPADLVRRVDELGRTHDGRRPGDLAFVREFVRLVGAERGRLEPRLDVAGIGRAVCAFVANCSPYTYAGSLALPVAPAAEFEAGLDLVAPGRVRPAAVVPTVTRVLFGRHEAHHDLDRIEVVCDDPMALHVDGEDLGDVREAVFEAERDAVSVLV